MSTARARTLRALKGMDGAGRLLLDGQRLAGAARAARVPFDWVGYAPEYYGDADGAKLIAELSRDGIVVERLPPRDFSSLSYKANGVVAIVRHRPPRASTVLEQPGLCVVLDGLSDPGNIGAVIRTANAWGAAGVLVVDSSARLFHPKCVRASMGALFHTPSCAVARSELLPRLAKRCVLALMPGGETVWSPEHLDGPAPVIVLGNELRGVHPDLARVATRRLSLPTAGDVDSLNVSNAAAVVLWEAFRRRSES